jgi:hypothetical protein
MLAVVQPTLYNPLPITLSREREKDALSREEGPKVGLRTGPNKIGPYRPGPDRLFNRSGPDPGPVRTG